MKTQIKTYMERFGPTFLMCAAALIWSVGCVTSKPTPDPLAGWTRCWSQDPKDFDKITADYRAYINSLPQELRVGVGPVEFLENKAGEHAIRIEIGVNGVDWAHILIYDINNNRIKVIKYVSGYYRS